MRGAVALLVLMFARAAWAQSSERDYLAARDQAGVELRQMAQMPEYNPTQKLGHPEFFTAAFHAEYDRHRRDVEVRLRDLLGPLAGLQGFSLPGTLNPALCCWGRFGALDGLSFDGASGNRVVVSTEGLLHHWLQESTDFWSANAKPSSDLPTLFQTASFYLWAHASDWPVLKFSDLPIGAPANVTTVGAFLASAGPSPWPDRIAVSVVKGGRIFVAFLRAKTKIAPIAICEAFAEQGAEAYRDCWAKRAKDQPWFADLLLETTAFAESLPD